MINEYKTVAADITLILKAQLHLLVIVSVVVKSYKQLSQSFYRPELSQYTMYRVKAGSGRSTGATLCCDVTTQTISISTHDVYLSKLRMSHRMTESCMRCT